MIIAAFTPDPTPPPVITQPSGTRYAQINVQGMIDTFQQWRQSQARKQKAQRKYSACIASVNRQSVLGHWDSETRSFQLQQQCGSDPSKPQPTLTIIKA
jgi:hypothetical protein